MHSEPGLSEAEEGLYHFLIWGWDGEVGDWYIMKKGRPDGCSLKVNLF